MKKATTKFTTIKFATDCWDRVRSWAILLIAVVFLIGCIILPMLFGLVKFLAFWRIAFGH